MYFIDIDTNGEVDFNATQLPTSFLARDVAELAPIFFRIVCRPDRIERRPEEDKGERAIGSGSSSSSPSSSSSSNCKHRATSAS